MAALSSLADARDNILADSNNIVKDLVERLNITLPINPYPDTDAGIVPQSWKNAETFLVLHTLAHRERVLLGIIEALAQRVADLESRRSASGGKK
jgi:hypothetical protein